MLSVRKEICAGCGICKRICPTGAISLGSDKKAQIDQSKCINCYRCVKACPRGAIVDVKTSLKPAASTIQELRSNLAYLQAEVQKASQRLKSLEQRRKIHHT